MLNDLVKRVLNGQTLTRDDIPGLLSADTTDLSAAANVITEHFCGKNIDLCAIISGKGGACSEDCKFCAQGAACKNASPTFPFLDTDKIVDDCRRHMQAGVHHYSIVTAGKTLNDNDFKKAAEAYKKMHDECADIHLCGSHGLLTYEQLLQLKNCGVIRYHCNIETSPSYFKKICTTHKFDEKLKTIKAAKRAGLEICSGGIIGMGESMDDRIDMAFTLAELWVQSVPINILMPIKGTPLENMPPLSEDEILRSLAVFRFILPKAEIRIAAGRLRLSGNGIKAFLGGANATITGDMLTTTGTTIAQDKEMLTSNGFII